MFFLIDISQGPADGVFKHLQKRRIIKQSLVVPHLEIDIPCFFRLIDPDDGMVAHLDFCADAVRVLVRASQHAHVAPRTVIISVPLVLVYTERIRHAAHHRMFCVLGNHRGIAGGCDVVLPSDTAHEVAEPLPHRARAEDIAQERCVMKAYVAALAFIYVMLEVVSGSLAPCLRRTIRGIIELQNKLELIEPAFLHLAQVEDVSHMNIQSSGIGVKPPFCSITETLMRCTLLDNGQYLARFFLLSLSSLRSHECKNKQ